MADRRPSRNYFLWTSFLFKSKYSWVKEVFFRDVSYDFEICEYSLGSLGVSPTFGHLDRISGASCAGLILRSASILLLSVSYRHSKF